MADGDEDQSGNEQGQEPGYKNLGVVSSCFSSLEYNVGEKSLAMTFAKDGRRYIIEGISEIEVERWVQSLSAGGYFNSFIRGNY